MEGAPAAAHPACLSRSPIEVAWQFDPDSEMWSPLSLGISGTAGVCAAGVPSIKTICPLGFIVIITHFALDPDGALIVGELPPTYSTHTGPVES